MFSVKVMWGVDITNTRSSSSLILPNFIASSSGIAIIKYTRVYTKQLAYRHDQIRTQSLV